MKQNTLNAIVFKLYYYYLGFNVAFNTVQVISRRVVGRAEETSTLSSLGFCTVNCRPTASNYQLSHLSLCGDRTPASEVGGKSVTTLPPWPLFQVISDLLNSDNLKVAITQLWHELHV